MFVLGKLLQTIKPADVEIPTRPEAEEPKIAASTGSSSGAEVKKVVTVSADSVKTSDSASRRRRIKSTAASETNESKSEGKVEGKD